MIDIHNHSLPGLDDGAKDIEQSILMCQMALNSGISHILMTPHIYMGRFENSIDAIRSSCFLLKDTLNQRGISINIAYAAEVMFSSEIIQLIESNCIPFVGKWEGADVILLEFPYYTMPLGMQELVDWLLARNIVPLVAHPERNKYFNKNKDVVQSLLKKGCLMQITSGSLLGKFGTDSRACAKYMIEKNWVSVVATDSHNCSRRAPDLNFAEKEITNIFSANVADKLLRELPWELTKQHWV